MPDHVRLTPGWGRLWTETSTVYRIGFPPHTFAWAPPDYDVRSGRWDDPTGDRRTTYVAEALFGALLESLRQFAPDPDLEDDLEDDPEDPSLPAGHLDRSWLQTRSTGRAQLHGRYLDVRDAGAIASLRARHRALAREVGLGDVDAAALKSPCRRFTQTVGAGIRALPENLDGICYASRHGDDLLMWAVFEQPTDSTPHSPQLTEIVELALTASTPELVKAMALFNLQWV